MGPRRGGEQGRGDQTPGRGCMMRGTCDPAVEDRIMASPSTIVSPGAAPAPTTPAVYPLEPGDHLTRDEFERRYQAMPELKKAELIEGVVYMPSPVRWDRHASPHVNLIT